MLILCWGCDPDDPNKPQWYFSNVHDIDQVGVEVGGPLGESLRNARDFLKHAKIKTLESDYSNVHLDELRSGTIDALVYDRPQLEHVALKNPEFVVMPDNIGMGHVGIAIAIKHKGLLDDINKFIAISRSDGIYNDMYQRWILSLDSPMPKITPPGKPDGKLVVGIIKGETPMSYVGNDGKVIGFDIEYAQRLGVFLNKTIIFKDMEFASLYSACASGEIDLAIAQMDKHSRFNRGGILFSNPYIDSSFTFMVRRVDCPDFTIRSIADMKGKTIAHEAIAFYENITNNIQKGINFVHMHDVNACVRAVIVGKVDGLVCDEPRAKALIARYPQDLRLVGNYRRDNYAIALKKNSPLLQPFNSVISELQRNGDLVKIREKWCSRVYTNEILQEWNDEPTGRDSENAIRVGFDPTEEPLAFVSPYGYAGHDLEVVNHIAHKLRKKAVFIPMGRSMLFETLQNGKIDVICGSVSPLPERLKYVDFTTPIFEGGITLIVRRNANTPALQEKDFWNRLYNRLWNAFVTEERSAMIVTSLLTTLAIAAGAAILGTLLGTLLWRMRKSHNPVLRWSSGAYILVLRGIPSLILLMLLCYVVFAQCNVHPIMVAAVGLGMSFAVVVYENILATAQIVSPAQKEAAAALGFTPYQALRHAYSYPVLRQLITVYRRDILTLVKETSIVGFIAVTDLTRVCDLIRTRTYDAVIPLCGVAIIYFVIIGVLSLLMRAWEKYLRYRWQQQNQGEN